MRPTWYTSTTCMLHMHRCEEQILKQLAVEQVTHPMEDYQPGSPRLEKLYASMEEARRFQSPKDLTFNV